GVFVRRRQLRIDHRDDRTDLRRAEPAGDELRDVGESKQHAVFDARAEIAQQVPGVIRLLHYFGVRPLLIAEAQTDLVAAPGGEVVVEEVLGHIESLRECHHAASPYSGRCAKPSISISASGLNNPFTSNNAIAG